MRLERLAAMLMLASAATLVAAACGSSKNDVGGKTTCSPGDTRTCVGPGACKGGQTCGNDGSWAACDCGGGGSAGSGGGGTGGASGTGGSGGADSGAAGGGGAGGTAGSGTGNCPANLPGPTLVDLGKFCIDSTEVSVAQYQQFLKAKNGDMSGQPSVCSGNTSYDIGCPQEPKGPNEPVRCISWCDASMYCAWAGKHLCGKIGGGSVTDAQFNDPTVFEWMYACSQGGTTAYPYGDTKQNDACVTDLSPYVTQGVQDVGSVSTCHGTTPPFDAIHDMDGNVGEYVNSCRYDPVHQDIRCAIRGSRLNTDEFACGAVLPVDVAWGPAATVQMYDGIRCCR